VFDAFLQELHCEFAKFLEIMRGQEMEERRERGRRADLLTQNISIVGWVQKGRETAVVLPTRKKDSSDIPKCLIVSD
jgi:hypothetical protein